jgi:hypothetical protein
MRKPRIYWICSHQTLRTEEVPLLLEAGAEVLPSIGDPLLLKYDPDYDNESDRHYPLWRLYTQLPTDVAESIRRIDLVGRKGVVTADEARLINRWIDALYIASFPETAIRALDWFEGCVVFRAFGHGDATTYSELLLGSGVNLDQAAASDRFIFCPILSSLGVPEDKRLTGNKTYLNAFVSPPRLGFTWKERHAKPRLCTTISYTDQYREAALQAELFAAHFHDVPYVILGKNKTAVSPGIAGHLAHDDFYAEMADSRLFVYLGHESNYHLHFTPIEAMAMGVPVLYLQRSGLAQEARDRGVRDDELKQAGMSASIEECRGLAVTLINDIDALRELSARQHELFLRSVFAREEALRRAEQLIDRIRRSRSRHDTAIGQLGPSKPPPVPHSWEFFFRPSSIQRDLPRTAGRCVRFSAEQLHGLIGRTAHDIHGRFEARIAELPIDPPGFLLADYLGPLLSGEYVFQLEWQCAERSEAPVGVFSMGVWHPDYVDLGTIEVKSTGYGEYNHSLSVRILSGWEALTKEIRFYWHGHTACGVKALQVTKVY